MGKRTAGNGCCEEPAQRGISAVTHPCDGLEERVQSTLSFHGCKFDDSANTREGKKSREAGEDRRLAVRERFMPAEACASQRSDPSKAI